MPATDEQRAWVARVLGFTPPSNQAADDDVPELREFLTDRLKIVNEDMRLYGLVKDLAGPLRIAAEAVKAGAPDAESLLDALEQQIAEAVARRRGDEARETIKAATVGARTGVVAFGKARLHLQTARSSYSLARENLVTACSALLKTADFIDDPRSNDPETLTAIAGIGDRVPDIDALSGAVDDALDTMISTSDTALRESARKGAVLAIATYRTALDADPILVRMQNTAAGSYPIRDALVGALDTLETALAA